MQNWETRRPQKKKALKGEVAANDAVLLTRAQVYATRTKYFIITQQ